MKAHLLIFDDDRVTLDAIIAIIDRMPEISNWHVAFTNTVCVVSDLGAKSLAGIFNKMLPDVRYLISEVEPQHKGGRINRSILDLLNAPGPVETEHA